MELTYQGLRIRLPLEGVIGVETFTLDASFNNHVSAELALIAEEEGIEAAVHQITDGDSIEVYEEGQERLLFAGKITDARMVNERSLC